VNTNFMPEWQKSSYCSTSACVEVAVTSNGVLVRDSKNPEVAPLSFNMDEWSAFVQGVRAGEFNQN
jgi:hypothetical protein